MNRFSILQLKEIGIVFFFFATIFFVASERVLNTLLSEAMRITSVFLYLIAAIIAVIWFFKPLFEDEK